MKIKASVLECAQLAELAASAQWFGLTNMVIFT